MEPCSCPIKFSQAFAVSEKQLRQFIQYHPYGSTLSNFGKDLPKKKEFTEEKEKSRCKSGNCLHNTDTFFFSSPPFPPI